jgi:hypothetical protein
MGFPGTGEVPQEPSPETSKRFRISPTVMGLVAIVVVVVVVVVIVVAGSGKSGPKSTLSTDSPKGTTATTTVRESSGAVAASPSLLDLVTGVPQSVFDKVGLPSEIVNYPKIVKGHSELKTASGLPVMLYVGAEYCPFCAAERWAMVIALSKFGTFSGLHTIHSSVTDFAPDTSTFTFYKSTYKSNYLVFAPYEVSTNQPATSASACNVDGYACLDVPPKQVVDIFQSVGGGSFPFMDFANKVSQEGAGFGDQPLLLAGLTPIEIAQQLSNPDSQVAQAEIGSANYITGAICAITGNQPADVCTAPYVPVAQRLAGVS